MTLIRLYNSEQEGTGLAAGIDFGKSAHSE